MRTDGRTETDMTKANSRLSQFCEHAKKEDRGMGHPVMTYERTDGDRSRLRPEIFYHITSATLKHQNTLTCHLMYIGIFLI
jgi:hypothetical protein